MKTIKMPLNQNEFRLAMRQAKHEGILLTERGRPVAAMVPIDGADAETLSMGTNRRFLAILRRSFKQLDNGRAVSLAEMRRRMRTPKSRRHREQ